MKALAQFAPPPRRPFRWMLLIAAALFLLLATVPLPAATARPTATHPADAALYAFFQQYLDAWLRERPFEATRLGDHRFDDRLEDLSSAAQDRRRQSLRDTLENLPRRVTRSTLSRDGAIDYEILEHDLRRSLWLEENTRPLAEDPRVYSEYISDSVFLPLTQSTLPLETNVANCLARMQAIPGIVDAARKNLTRPPRTHTETAIRQNLGAISFYETDLPGLARGSRQLAALRAEGRRVAATLRGYQEFLEKELLPKADGDWRLGATRFREKLALDLNAGLSADEVLAQAESEFQRVQAELYVVARQLWSRYHPAEALPPDHPDGRRATIARVMQDVGAEHGKPEHLVRDARRIVVSLKRFIRERDFLRLPDPDQCAVIEMPEFQRGNSTAYLSSAPPLDPEASSYYAVSPPPSDWSPERVRSYLEEYNTHMLHILSLHEAYPGHYVQLEYANRHPSPIRRVIQSGPFIEGWAVYTEQTMLNEGYGDGDLRLRLMQLKFYLRAVVNALLDHRMHCTQMTDDQALELLMRDAFQSEGEARLKVIRSQQSAGQLSTYFVGRMALDRVRREIQTELGAAFVLGRFHEAVLAHGCVPPRYLLELVRRSLGLPASQ